MSDPARPRPLLEVTDLATQPYEKVWAAMTDFTNQRSADTPDQLWLVQHPPVFTQGQAGKAEHLLVPGDIPVIQSDRASLACTGEIAAYMALIRTYDEAVAQAALAREGTST